MGLIRVDNHILLIRNRDYGYKEVGGWNGRGWKVCVGFAHCPFSLPGDAESIGYLSISNMGI